MSLAALTQIVSALGQLVLLPLQMRLWGVELTAHWYAAIAFGYLASASDLGLRVAGHADLVKARTDPADSEAALRFAKIWAAIRSLVLILTLAILATDLVVSGVMARHEVRMWRSLLVIAFGAETLLIIRSLYMDSCGRHLAAEASYFGFSLLRLVGALALLAVGAGPDALGGLYIASAATGLALQEYLCRSIPQLGLLQSFQAKSAHHVLGQLRHTFSEPLANWVRLSLPVLVLSAVADARVTTLYVGLRALFGTVRATTLQFGRYVSVAYIAKHRNSSPSAADRMIGRYLACASAFGATCGAMLLADNGRTLATWLGGQLPEEWLGVALSFVFAAPFFAHHLLQATLMRAGHVRTVALRQYAYVALSAAAAAYAWLSASWGSYMMLLLCSEILVALLFISWRERLEAVDLPPRGQGLVQMLIWTGILLATAALPQVASADLFIRREWPAVLAATGLAIAACTIVTGAIMALEMRFTRHGQRPPP